MDKSTIWRAFWLYFLNIKINQQALTLALSSISSAGVKIKSLDERIENNFLEDALDISEFDEEDDSFNEELVNLEGLTDQREAHLMLANNFSGMIFVIINNLIGDLFTELEKGSGKKNFGFEQNIKFEVGDSFSKKNHKVAKIINAASNNYRHSSEWDNLSFPYIMKHKKHDHQSVANSQQKSSINVSNQQMLSIQPLIDILGVNDKLTGLRTFNTLEIIMGKDLDAIECHSLEFDTLYSHLDKIAFDYACILGCEEEFRSSKDSAANWGCV